MYLFTVSQYEFTSLTAAPPRPLLTLSARRAYGMEAVFVHDAAALAAVVAPQLFDWTCGRVLVVEDGPARGRTVLDDLKRTWMGANAWQGLPDAQVALGVRDGALVEWVLERMGRGAPAGAGAA
jgi:inosine-uridine nucleoside N-ribohydrolase